MSGGYHNPLEYQRTTPDPRADWAAQAAAAEKSVWDRSLAEFERAVEAAGWAQWCPHLAASYGAGGYIVPAICGAPVGAPSTWLPTQPVGKSAQVSAEIIERAMLLDGLGEPADEADAERIARAGLAMATLVDAREAVRLHQRAVARKAKAEAKAEAPRAGGAFAGLRAMMENHGP